MQNLSKGAVQAGLAVDVARRLEGALAAAGATGKGLHEKVGSIESRLPQALVTRLRFIASVRNKIVHEDELLSDDELSAFTEAGKQALDALGARAKPGRKRQAAKARGRGKPARAAAAGPQTTTLNRATFGLGGLLIVAGVALVFLLMLLGNDGPRLWGGAFAIYLLLGSWFLKRLRRTADGTAR